MAEELARLVAVLEVEQNKYKKGLDAARATTEKQAAAMQKRLDQLAATVNSRMAETANTLNRSFGSVLGNFASRIGPVGSALQTLGPAGTAAAAGLGAAALAATGLLNAAKESITYVAGINDAAQRTGVSVEAFQELTFAFEQGGVEAADAQGAIAKLNSVVGDAAAGSKSASDAFAAVGVSVKDANGQIRPTEAILADIADAFAGIDDPARKAAIAADLFGRGAGTKMIAVLADGSAGLRAMAAEAHNLGAIISTETVEAAAKFDDQLTALATTLKAKMAEALVQLGPVLVEINREMGEILPAAAKLAADVLLFVARNMNAVAAAAGAFVAIRVGVAIVSMVQNFNLLRTAAAGAATGMAALRAATIAFGGPITLAVTALTAGIVALADQTSAADEAQQHFAAAAGFAGTAADTAGVSIQGLTDKYKALDETARRAAAGALEQAIREQQAGLDKLDDQAHDTLEHLRRETSDNPKRGEAGIGDLDSALQTRIGDALAKIENNSWDAAQAVVDLQKAMQDAAAASGDAGGGFSRVADALAPIAVDVREQTDALTRMRAELAAASGDLGTAATLIAQITPPAEQATQAISEAALATNELGRALQTIDASVGQKLAAVTAQMTALSERGAEGLKRFQEAQRSALETESNALQAYSEASGGAKVSADEFYTKLEQGDDIALAAWQASVKLTAETRALGVASGDASSHVDQLANALSRYLNIARAAAASQAAAKSGLDDYLAGLDHQIEAYREGAAGVTRLNREEAVRTAQQAALQQAQEAGLSLDEQIAAQMTATAKAGELYDLQQRSLTTTRAAGAASQKEENEALREAASLIQATASPLETYLAAQQQIIALKPALIELLGSEAAANERINLALSQAALAYRDATEAQQQKAAAAASANQATEGGILSEKQLGEVAQQTGQSIVSNLSQAAQGAKTFEQAVYDIIEALIEMLTQMLIIKPLMDAIGGIDFSGAGSPAGTIKTAAVKRNAKGNAFSAGSIIPFANGGVVSRPTIFPMANGGVGLMGEAGEEAILPLARGQNGKLGVRASGGATSGGNVTIIDQRTADQPKPEVQQRRGRNGQVETTIMLRKAINDHISSGGADQALAGVGGRRQARR